jgi:hypothetical protein
MAVKEDYAGRHLDGTTYERKYWVEGHVDDETAAKAELLASIPATLGGTFARQNKECSVDEVKPGVYEGRGVWRTPEGGGERPINSFTISFDISGQTVRVTQALTHRGDYAADGKNARTFKGAINVTKDGIQGTEIIVPYATLTINYTLAKATITDAYFRTLGDLVGCQNDAPFKGFAAGELLLTRVSGNVNSNGDFDISFGFAISRNKINLVVDSADGPITIPEKRGWDFLWTFSEQRTQTVGDMTYTSLVPVSAHLEQVYWDNDMTLLGI